MQLSVFLSYNKHSLVNEEAIQKQLNQNNANLKGVIYFKGELNLTNCQLNELLNESVIFAVDASSVEIFKEVKASLERQGMGDFPVEVDMSSPYWYIENTIE